MDRLQSAARSRAAAILVPGIAVALPAVLAFGIVHAWLIVPIWSRLPGAVPMAVAACVALAWAFDTVARARTAAEGARFGVVMVATLLPPSALDAVMRMPSLRLHEATAVVVADVLLYVVGGAAAGWWLARRSTLVLSLSKDERSRRPMIATAVATLALMAVSGGPLPLTRSARAVNLSLAIAVITVAACVLVAMVRRFCVGPAKAGPHDRTEQR